MRTSSITKSLGRALTCAFICAASLGFSDQDGGWRGRKKTIDGIINIINPPEPIYAETIYEIREEYTIKSTNDKGEYVLNKPVAMALGFNNRLYVLDPPEGDVKVFDDRGQFLKSFGRKGQGPGELGVPNTIIIGNQGEILIADSGNRRLNIYDHSGTYETALSTSTVQIREIGINPKGGFIGIVQMRIEDHFRYELRTFDPSMKYMRTLKYDDDYIGSKPSIFTPSTCLAMTSNDQIVYGFPEKEYLMDVFNGDGELVKRIHREIIPKKVPEEEIKKSKDKISPSLNVYIPEYLPAYFGINADDEGRIIVFSEFQFRSHIAVFDIFSNEGNYLARINLPNIIRPNNCIWRNNRFYAFAEDLDGSPIIKVYKAKWKY